MCASAVHTLASVSETATNLYVSLARPLAPCMFTMDRRSMSAHALAPITSCGILQSVTYHQKGTLLTPSDKQHGLLFREGSCCDVSIDECIGAVTKYISTQSREDIHSPLCMLCMC